MSSARLNYLLTRFYDKTCTPAEKAELLAVIGSGTQDDLVEDLLEELMEEHTPDETADRDQAERLYMQIHGVVAPAPVKKMRNWWWAAAAVVLLAGTSAAFLLHRSKNTSTQTATVFKDVNPGTSKATLTLADGSVVALDSNGQQNIQQGMAALHQQGGHIVYEATGTDNTVLQYNTLSTPRGGQFRISLPDGSEVWLNASSSIRYPVAFTGKDRRVEITGEAYFEVAKNAQQPFFVQMRDGAEVEVLGTHFNINAYADEPTVRTTLAEGSVKVRSNGQQVTLQPGQQAQIAGGNIGVNKPDVAQVLAWKNGIFNFENNDLEEVMRQLARWYDVKIQYNGNISPRTFGGELQRSLRLSQVLEALGEMHVNVQLKDGNTIVVAP